MPENSGSFPIQPKPPFLSAEMNQQTHFGAEKCNPAPSPRYILTKSSIDSRIGAEACDIAKLSVWNQYAKNQTFFQQIPDF
jgi:hypothetical protein